MKQINFLGKSFVDAKLTKNFLTEKQSTMSNKSKQIVRTHDEFYAKVDPKAPPKDSFIQIADLIDDYKKSFLRGISVVDFGCASGAFVNYLNSRFPDDHIIGYEYLATLVKSGKENYPNIQIKQGSIIDESSLPKSSVDVLTLLGVISIFDDIEPIIHNLTRWIKPGGKVFIHGMFNPLDVDVYVKYKLSENFDAEECESGWNIISQKTISRLLRKHGIKNIKFHDFSISVDLDKNANDPLRSWTEKMRNGDRQIINGTCLKQPQFILEADL
jgi:2-polyprenyl-3-methyl-5-hydroxy-6-metoxy-1,4-benzoquinol methylase